VLSDVLNINEFPNAIFGMPDLNGNQKGKLNGITKYIVPIGSNDT